MRFEFERKLQSWDGKPWDPRQHSLGVILYGGMYMYTSNNLSLKRGEEADWVQGYSDAPLALVMPRLF